MATGTTTSSTYPPHLPLSLTPNNLQPTSSPLLNHRTISTSSPHLGTTFSYNNLIRAHVSNHLHAPALHLFLEMLDHGVPPNEFTFPFVLKSSSNLGFLYLGRQIHTQLVKSSLFSSNVFCAAALLDLYGKWASLEEAIQVFDRIPLQNEVAWNSMLSALAQNGHLERCLEMLNLMESLDLVVVASSWNSIINGCVRLGDAELALEMLGMMVSSSSVKPNSATFNTLLPVIPNIPSLNLLKKLHGFVFRILDMVDMDSVDEDRLCSAIAAGYAFHGCMDDASLLFERVKVKTTQLWISMISGFLDCKSTCEALDVFREMAFELGQEGKTLSRVSLSLLLSACSRDSRAGLEIHGYAYRNGLESNNSVCNALMAMYARRGEIELSEKVFERTSEKDIISWNTMVANYALIHDFDRAFLLFKQMVDEGIKPDEYSLSSVLNGCGHASYLRQGTALHGCLIKSGFYQSYPVVQNALMDAYGKCACVEDARKVFKEIESRDKISWNTIISCYGYNACPQEALSLFKKMRERGWKPNRVTFIALLSACSHAGLLDEALHIFERMTRDHGIVPDLDHYACIVDGLGRAGQLERAYQFIKDMPIEPDDCIWSALLSGCRTHGNIKLAEVAAKYLIELEPQNSGYWVLLSNTYADAARWNDARHVRTAMKDAGVEKCPGYSWIEVGGSQPHKFFTGDMSHKQTLDIHFALHGLTEQLKDEGYTPITDYRSISFG